MIEGWHFICLTFDSSRIIWNQPRFHVRSLNYDVLSKALQTARLSVIKWCKSVTHLVSYKHNGKIWKLLIWRRKWPKNYTSSTWNRDFIHSWQGLMLHFALFTLRDGVLVNRSASSITPDQNELASRDSHQWTLQDLPNQMLCNMSSFQQLRDLRCPNMTLTWGKHPKLLHLNKKAYKSTRLRTENTIVSKWR